MAFAWPAFVLSCPDPVTRSQLTFSLNPDPDENLEVTSFISVVVYRVYIPLSRPTQFCQLFNNNKLKKNVRDPPRIPKKWIKDPKRVLLIFMGLEFFSQRKLCHTKYYSKENQRKYSEARTYQVSPESTFKNKIPQGMEHVWSSLSPDPAGPLLWMTWRVSSPVLAWIWSLLGPDWSRL